MSPHEIEPLRNHVALQALRIAELVDELGGLRVELRREGYRVASAQAEVLRLKRELESAREELRHARGGGS